MTETPAQPVPASSPPRATGSWNPDRMPQNLRRLMFVSVIVSFLFAAIFVWSDKGLGELRRLDRHGRELRADVDALQLENARLRDEVTHFPEKKFRIERLAREELGLVRPDEIVLILPTSSTRPPADRTDPPVTAEMREKRAGASNLPPDAPRAVPGVR